MTDNVILGIDFGGKKAKEQEEITETLREIGRKTAVNFGWHEPVESGYIASEKDPA